MQRGTLSKLIKKFEKERLPIELAVFYTAEIIQTLEYLHGRGIIHRDLKPQNILITSDFHVKLVNNIRFLILIVRLWWCNKAKIRSTILHGLRYFIYAALKRNFLRDSFVRESRDAWKKYLFPWIRPMGSWCDTLLDDLWRFSIQSELRVADLLADNQCRIFLPGWLRLRCKRPNYIIFWKRPIEKTWCRTSRL